MKKIKFTESQIIQAIKSYEGGRRAEDISRELGINRATFYEWKRKYSGMDSQHLRHMKELEEENKRLKSMYADLALDYKILKDVLSKKL